jgi:hypothetical protein
MGYPDCSFRGFLQFIQANAKVVLQLGHYRFVPKILPNSSVTLPQDATKKEIPTS